MDLEVMELLKRTDFSTFTESEQELVRTLFKDCEIHYSFGLAYFKFNIGYGLMAIVDGTSTESEGQICAFINFDSYNRFRFYDNYKEVPYEKVMYRLNLIDEIENTKLELRELFGITSSDKTRATTYFNQLEKELPKGLFDKDGEINIDYNLENNFDNLLITYNCMLKEKTAFLIEDITESLKGK